MFVVCSSLLHLCRGLTCFARPMQRSRLPSSLAPTFSSLPTSSNQRDVAEGSFWEVSHLPLVHAPCCNLYVAGLGRGGTRWVESRPGAEACVVLYVLPSAPDVRPVRGPILTLASARHHHLPATPGAACVSSAPTRHPRSSPSESSPLAARATATSNSRACRWVGGWMTG